MEDPALLRALLALAFVAGLVLLMGWALRRWDIAKLAGKLQQGRRLQLLEQLYLDPKRKLVLLRCDAQEYLLLMGAGSEQMVALEKKNEA